jgi:lipoprotein-releasing system permease protein
MEWFVALRYLRGKHRLGFLSLRSIVSAGGVFLGALVLVIALSIANGFEKEVRDRIVGTLAHAKIMHAHGGPVLPYDSLMQEIEKRPGVEATAPYIELKGGVEYDQVQEAVLIMGIDPAREEAVTDLRASIKYGAYSLDSMISNRDRRQPGILVGLGLADKLGVRQGSELVVGTLVPVGGRVDPVPRMARFVVTGIFETGMYEYDLNLVYMSLESAQRLAAIGGVDGIKLQTADLFHADNIAASVRESLGRDAWRVTDWKSQNKSLFKWMKLEKLIIFVVISLIMVVAAFNIISSLVMMIYEKRREVGILMSMGTTSRSIMRVFMLNGTVVGFIGSTLGAALGAAICIAQRRWGFIPLPGDIYFIDTLPVLVQPLDVVAVFAAANCICLLAAGYPAWRASRMLPAESIRYE